MSNEMKALQYSLVISLFVLTLNKASDLIEYTMVKDGYDLGYIKITIFLPIVIVWTIIALYLIKRDKKG